MPNITTETIKKITATVTEENEITLGEIQAIYEAAQKDTFWLICHAYAYGFHRGYTVRRKAAIDLEGVEHGINQSRTDLWSIAANLDDIHSTIERVFNLLHIFEECLDNEFDILRESNDCCAAYFLDRYEMLQSLMDTMQIVTYEASTQMRTHIDAIYDIDRQAAT